MSDYTEAFIKDKLIKELEAEHCEVTDLSDGCGGKFDAVIVSKKFEGVGLLARHRMVNAILQEELNVIHAFTQKTLTPEQWASKNTKN
jgi:stress-induced morphogen